MVAGSYLSLSAGSHLSLSSVGVVSRWSQGGSSEVVSGWYQGGIRVVSGWYQGGIRKISDESSGFRNFCLVFGFSFLINRCPGQNSGIRTDF